MTRSSGPEPSSSTLRDWRVLVPLGVVMLLGLLLRVYRLDEQSLWWDDYNGLAHLTINGFFASMMEARRMNPEGAPLYHVVQYFASYLIGTGEYAQRMLNVGIGTLTIPVVFLIGRNSFGVRAGLIAALLFAMSPPHIYHAQSLRIYPLAMLLGAISLLSMERMLTQRNPRWLYLNVLANGALCLTHLFGLFGVIAQGVAALLILGWHHRVLLMRWSVIQFVCLLPSALLVLTMRRRSGGDFWHFSFPSFIDIVKDLVGDDLTNFALNPTPSPTRLFGVAIDQDFLTIPMAIVMMLLFLMVAGWALVHTWKLRQRALEPAATHADSTHADGTLSDRTVFTRFVLMLTYWSMPVVFIVLLAYFWQPVVYPRYTLYACLGSYALTGAFFVHLPWRVAKASLVCAILILYAFQLGLLLNSDTRTQWRQVTEGILLHAGPNDIVLVGGFGPPAVSHQTLGYHFPADAHHPITPVHSTLDLLEQLRCHFLGHGGEGAPPKAWYVFNSHYGLASHEVPTRYFVENEIQFDTRIYQAEETIFLFRIHDWADLTHATPIVLPDLSDIESYTPYDHAADMQALQLDHHDERLTYLFERAFEDGIIFGGELGLTTQYATTFCDFGEYEAAHQVLSQYEEVSGENLDPLRWYIAITQGDLEAAFAVPMRSAEHPFARLMLEITLWAAGDADEAVRSYRAHRALISNEPNNMGPLLDALLLEDTANFHAKVRQFRTTLRPHGDDIHKILCMLGGLENWISACQPPWQPQSASPETIRAAKAMLASYK